MKEVYLIRHAKSSWKDITLSDFFRPLNGRGKRDAPVMANYIKELGIMPDCIITSPAKRARKTAKIFSNIIEYENEIIYDELLYEADIENIMEVVKQYLPRCERLFIFGHNPGLTECANYMTSEYIDNIPTMGIVGISVSPEAINKSTLMRFEYPKKLL